MQSVQGTTEHEQPAIDFEGGSEVVRTSVYDVVQKPAPEHPE
jgi:hypothetical protein